jgi:hypothetical protein
MALAWFVEYLCNELAIPDITINLKDVTVKEAKKQQQEATAKLEGIPRIPVAKWNNKINATI